MFEEEGLGVGEGRGRGWVMIYGWMDGWMEMEADAGRNKDRKEREMDNPVGFGLV